MTCLRSFVCSLLLALSASLDVSIARADDDVPPPPVDDETLEPLAPDDAPIPEGDDVRGPLLMFAAFTSGFFAFNLALELADIPAFGPEPVVTASLAVTSLGFLASHVGALALLDPDVYADPRQRTFFTGLSLLGTSLGLIGVAVPSCFAVTSGPLDGSPEDIAVVAPFFLGGMGIVGAIAGAVWMNEALEMPDVSIDLAASPQGGMITFSGTF